MTDSKVGFVADPSWIFILNMSDRTGVQERRFSERHKAVVAYHRCLPNYVSVTLSVHAANGDFIEHIYSTEDE